MNENLLYFPYIDIPNNSWTIKSILYWQNIGVIVPPKYIDLPQQYEQYTVDLMQTDLIQPIFPGEYIWQVPNFDQSFIKLVDQPKYNLAKKQENFRNQKYSRIHFQKFGEDLLNHLVKLKIAKRRDWQWFEVENKTARLLMMYLATVIGKTGGFTPATDKIKNLDTSISQSGNLLRLNSIRQNLIEDLIPYPIAPHLTKLRRFKDKYHEELSSFRTLLEKATFEISNIKKEKKQTTKHNLIIEEINDKRQKISSEMNGSRLGQITFGTICGITGAAVGFASDNKPLGLFSLASAVYSAFQGYDKKPILNKDYTYLALIDKNFK